MAMEDIREEIESFLSDSSFPSCLVAHDSISSKCPSQQRKRSLAWLEDYERKIAAVQEMASSFSCLAIH